MDPRRCPNCANEIGAKAVVCVHCDFNLMGDDQRRSLRRHPRLIATAFLMLVAAGLGLGLFLYFGQDPRFDSADEIQHKLEQGGMTCRYRSFASPERIMCNYADPTSDHYQSVLNDRCRGRPEGHERYCMEEALGQYIVAVADLEFPSDEARETFLRFTCLEVASDDAPPEAFDDACIVGPNWFVIVPNRELAYRTQELLGGGDFRGAGRLDPEQARVEKH